MALVEIQLLVHDGFPDDGQPVTVDRGVGAWVSPAELTDWVQNSIVPASVNAIPTGRKKQLRARIRKVKLLTAPARTVPEVAEAYWEAIRGAGTVPWASLPIADQSRWEAKATTIMDRATDYLAEVLASGLDTKWGSGDLSSLFIIVADLPELVIEDLTRAEVDLTAPAVIGGRHIGNSIYRFQYWTFPEIDAAKLIQIRNPAIRVDVDRVTAPKTILDMVEMP